MRRRALLVPLLATLAIAGLPAAAAQGGHGEHVEGGFDSGAIAPGGAFAYRFDRAGEYAYHCVPHPGSMQARVVVREGEPARNATVDLVDFGIEPAEVVVGPGSVVTWHNRGAVEHTASQTSGPASPGAPLAASGPAPAGGSGAHGGHEAATAFPSLALALAAFGAAVVVARRR